MGLSRRYSPSHNLLALRVAALPHHITSWAPRLTTSFTLTPIIHVLRCHYALLLRLRFTTIRPAEKLHPIIHQKVVETNALRGPSHRPHIITGLRLHPRQLRPAPRPFHIMRRSRPPHCSIKSRLLPACLECHRLRRLRSPLRDGRARACRHHPGSLHLILIPVSRI